MNLLESLFSNTGLNGSAYEKINSTYGIPNTASAVSGNLSLQSSIQVGYTSGKRLNDNSIANIVGNAINSGQLPKDSNGLYFVLTSSDVAETSGFCSRYCGWHTSG